MQFKDEVINGKGKRTLQVNWDICIFCGQCQANCLTEKGIKLTQEFDLATTEKREELKQVIEKELILCECCGDPILPRAQYDWVVKKLGSLCFPNSSLLTFYFRALGIALPEETSPNKDTEFMRSERIKILCPRCRREAVITS